MPGGHDTVREVALPPRLRVVTDLAPVRDGERPTWLTLGEDGTINHWDEATGRHEAAATTTVPDEPDHDPWDGSQLRRHLHASHYGRVAAVVNDYGRFGEVLDLRTGEITLDLENDGDHQETVQGASPEHDRDHFHGALHVSPDGKRSLDEGWMWHPFGFPSVWSLDHWIEDDVWESEDDPSRGNVCGPPPRIITRTPGSSCSCQTGWSVR